MRSIYWFRSDLRLLDNEALSQCLSKNKETIFIFAQTKSFKRAGSIRKNFLTDHISEFIRQIKDTGFNVMETDKEFSEFISTLHDSHPFDELYYTQEYAWEERLEESKVGDFCRLNNIMIQSFDQGTLIAEADLPFSLQEMPFIFTDFRKKVEQNLKVRPLVSYPLSIKENPGLKRLKYYLWESKAIDHYKETRNGMINFDDSTKLSPWINIGFIGPRQIFHELKKYESQVCSNDSTYWLLFELMWRDYMKFFSKKFGNKIYLPSGVTPGKSLNENNLDKFNSWCQGETSDEFINANMNELNMTGWMSNRGRQNVASYLIHDLGVNWTWGARYFEEKLIDYDPDLNWGNWLYLSGRGSDPRARKFNTRTQALTYDQSGEYRKLWS